MATLRPFRDYSEHDVINLFAFDYAGTALVQVTSLRSKRARVGFIPKTWIKRTP